MPPPSRSKLFKKSHNKSSPCRSNHPLSWPPLQPLVPTTDLTLETLLPDQILIIRNLFTSTFCRKLVSFLATLPLSTTPGQPKKGEALRVNDRFEVDDPGFAERLWKGTGLETLVIGSKGEGEENGEGEEIRQKAREEERRRLWGGEVVGLNPRIRVYKYGKGQFFGQHCKWIVEFSFCLGLGEVHALLFASQMHISSFLELESVLNRDSRTSIPERSEAHHKKDPFRLQDWILDCYDFGLMSPLPASFS